MNAIDGYLAKNGYRTMTTKWDSYVTLWDALYKGFLKEFHEYQQYNGKKYVSRRRSSLGMACKICQDHASLLLNEKCDIETGSEDLDKKIKSVFEFNNFKIRANQLIEVAFALGTGAFVEYEDADKNIVIDYIRAQMIHPIEWDNGEITQCAFGSTRFIGGKEVHYVNIHEKDSKGNYVIKNKFFEINTDGKEESYVDVEVDGVIPELDTKSPTPRFQIVTPNLTNNLEYDCPMGISVFANAIDLLKGTDLIFDSYVSEFRLGRKRVIIPQSMIQMAAGPNNVMMPTFDDNDIEFYAVDSEVSDKIEETGGELRHEAHEAALNRMLSLLSDACMLGPERYSFNSINSGVVKTATEVVNEQSDMFRYIKKNELVIENALIGITKVIAELSNIKLDDVGIKINFDDSIIEDTSSKRNRMQMLVMQDRFPLWRYLKEYEGYDEETAKQIAEESKPVEPKIDFAKGADEL